MGRYVRRRSLLIVPTVFGVTLLAFGVIHLTPGDPVADRFRRIEGRSPTAEEVAGERRALGLDRPLLAQYLGWVGGAVHGDLGTSISSGRAVSTELRLRVPATLELSLVAGLLSLAFAVPTGLVAAVRQNRLSDHLLRTTSLAGASMPSFWLGVILIEVLAVRADWFPASGRRGMSSVVLPAVTLALGPGAVLARFIRAALLETLGEDYVRTARAKGLRSMTVLCGHALRTALVPVVTAFGTSLGHLVAGTVLVETVFTWPGVGQLSVDAIAQRDYPVMQGVVLYVGVAFCVLNLLVDLLCGAIDPRIRLGGRSGARARA